jgi:hypothetical protein
MAAEKTRKPTLMTHECDSNHVGAAVLSANACQSTISVALLCARCAVCGVSVGGVSVVCRWCVGVCSVFGVSCVDVLVCWCGVCWCAVHGGDMQC